MTTAAPESLSAESVAPHLRGRFGTPYLYEPECESTQLLLLGSGLPEGAVAATDYQTGGKGRQGRRWVAPPGSSILVSVLLHPPADRRLPELSLVAALAAAEAIEAATGLSTQIKWPNDVMLNRRKVAGILAELSDGVVIVGIGINVDQSRDELPLDAPTEPGSLRSLTGSSFSRAAILGFAPACARAGLRRVARTAGSTRCTAESARATSSAAGGSPSTARKLSPCRSSATDGSRSRARTDTARRERSSRARCCSSASCRRPRT